jgi:creatinine amidohydrolase
MDLIELEKLTWPAIEDRMSNGFDTVLFACGAVEQHGRHLPLFADAEHGTELAKAIALRLGQTLVAPTIRVGCSDHHMGFKGTLSLRATTLRAICEDYVDSIAAHGFRRILIVPSHGGNFGPISEMLPDLNQRAGQTTVYAFTDLIAFIDVWRNVIQSELG